MCSSQIFSHCHVICSTPPASYHLQLSTNRITLLLSNFLDTEEEGDEAANTRKATKVWAFNSHKGKARALC